MEQHPLRARMARAAVCMLYTLTDGTGAPQQPLLTYYTIHMEQHPLRARMARAAVCRLYTLTDGTGAPQRTAGHILPSAWSNSHSAHGWHMLRSVGCRRTRMAQEHQQQPLLTYYTIHMEQQPQRARMARAAVCMLYTLTDGTGAPTATATDIEHHRHGATPAAGTDGTCCGLYAVHPHGWHRSTAANRSAHISLSLRTYP